MNNNSYNLSTILFECYSNYIESNCSFLQCVDWIFEEEKNLEIFEEHPTGYKIPFVLPGETKSNLGLTVVDGVSSNRPELINYINIDDNSHIYVHGRLPAYKSGFYWTKNQKIELQVNAWIKAVMRRVQDKFAKKLMQNKLLYSTIFNSFFDKKDSLINYSTSNSNSYKILNNQFNSFTSEPLEQLTHINLSPVKAYSMFNQNIFPELNELNISHLILMDEVAKKIGIENYSIISEENIVAPILSNSKNSNLLQNLGGNYFFNGQPLIQLSTSYDGGEYKDLRSNRGWIVEHIYLSNHVGTHIEITEKTNQLDYKYIMLYAKLQVNGSGQRYNIDIGFDKQSFINENDAIGQLIEDDIFLCSNMNLLNSTSDVHDDMDNFIFKNDGSRFCFTCNKFYFVANSSYARFYVDSRVFRFRDNKAGYPNLNFKNLSTFSSFISNRSLPAMNDHITLTLTTPLPSKQLFVEEKTISRWNFSRTGVPTAGNIKQRYNSDFNLIQSIFLVADKAVKGVSVKYKDNGNSIKIDQKEVINNNKNYIWTLPLKENILISLFKKGNLLEMYNNYVMRSCVEFEVDYSRIMRFDYYKSSALFNKAPLTS